MIERDARGIVLRGHFKREELEDLVAVVRSGNRAFFEAQGVPWENAVWWADKMEAALRAEPDMAVFEVEPVYETVQDDVLGKEAKKR